MRLLDRLEGWFLNHKLGAARLVLAALTCLLFAFALAVSNLDTSLGLQVEPVASPSAQGSAATEVEIAALRAQFNQAQLIDERLLQTVYWTLGTVVTVALVLVGFSWFTNERLAAADRKQLRQEIESELHTRVGLAEENMNQELQRIEHRALGRVSSAIEKAEQGHEARFAQLQQNLWGTQHTLLVSIARAEQPLGNSAVVLNTAAQMVSLGKQAGISDAISDGLEILQFELSRSTNLNVTLIAIINEAIMGLPVEFGTTHHYISERLAEITRRTNVDNEWEG